MVWRDIFIKKILPKETIVTAFARVFRIDEQMVKIIKDIEQFTNHQAEFSVKRLRAIQSFH